MYYNDTISRNVKSLTRRRKPFKDISLQPEVTPLLKENNNTTYVEAMKIEVEVETASSSNGSTVSNISDDTLTDGTLIFF